AGAGDQVDELGPRHARLGPTVGNRPAGGCAEPENAGGGRSVQCAMRTTLAVLSLVAALGTPLSAQPGSDPAPQPGQSMTMTDLFEQIRRVEPIRRAGLRAGLLRQAQQVVPVVVVVSDARSYLAALSAWEGAR